MNTCPHCTEYNLHVVIPREEWLNGETNQTSGSVLYRRRLDSDKFLGCCVGHVALAAGMSLKKLDGIGTLAAIGKRVPRVLQDFLDLDDPQDKNALLLNSTVASDIYNVNDETYLPNREDVLIDLFRAQRIEVVFI